MKEKEVLDLFGRVGAVTSGHFIFTFGKHGSAYFNKDAIYPHVMDTSSLCRAIAERFANYGVEVVIAPAVGGVILSQWIAHHLTEVIGREVLGVYAEKAMIFSPSAFWHLSMFFRLIFGQWIPELGSPPKEQFVIRRGYDKIVYGKRVLVVDDVLNSGGSAKQVVEATHAAGGNVVGVAALCNRGGVTPHDVADAPELFALVTMKLDAWDASDCPLCAQGVAINTDIGKGREFR